MSDYHINIKRIAHYTYLVEIGWSSDTPVPMGAVRVSRLALRMVSFASMLGVVMALVCMVLCLCVNRHFIVFMIFI